MTNATLHDHVDKFFDLSFISGELRRPSGQPITQVRVKVKVRFGVGFMVNVKVKPIKLKANAM